jgi:hypothetical protein
MFCLEEIGREGWRRWEEEGREGGREGGRKGGRENEPGNRTPCRGEEEDVDAHECNGSFLS